MSEKTRYSDEELEEFKALILEKIELSKRDYEQMMDVLTNRSGNGVDDTMPTYKVLEEGIDPKCSTYAEVYPRTSSCTRSYRKQDLWCLPSNWQIDSQGKTSCCASCYIKY